MEVFCYMEEHKKNIELYLEMGGDAKIANRHKLPTLQNRARIIYLISKFPKNFQKLSPKIEEKTPIESSIELNVTEPEPISSKPKGLGLIAQYPVELHKSYQLAYQNWVSVCSLKIQLNNVPPSDEKNAFKLQTEILYKMEIFDKNKEALDYYNQFKRLIPLVSDSDFSKLTPLEILNKRNNIRGLITRRKQTINKMIADLPEESSKDYHKKLAAINLKKENLQKLILDEQKLNQLMK